MAFTLPVDCPPLSKRMTEVNGGDSIPVLAARGRFDAHDSPRCLQAQRRRGAPQGRKKGCETNRRPHRRSCLGEKEDAVRAQIARDTRRPLMVPCLRAPREEQRQLQCYTWMLSALFHFSPVWSTQTPQIEPEAVSRTVSGICDCSASEQKFAVDEPKVPPSPVNFSAQRPLRPLWYHSWMNVTGNLESCLPHGSDAFFSAAGTSACWP